MTEAFVFGNLQAIAWELVVLLPVVGVAYWWGKPRSNGGTRNE
jgi:hypothetical protein